MIPTLTMALPPKKVDICTMIPFRGELAASTEVSLAVDTQQDPLSSAHHCTSCPHPPLHFTALASGSCNSPTVAFQHFSQLLVLFQVL